MTSDIVRVYYNSLYKVVFCFFTLISDLELLTLEKRKMREQDPFSDKIGGKGGLVPAYHCTNLQ